MRSYTNNHDIIPIAWYVHVAFLSQLTPPWLHTSRRSTVTTALLTKGRCTSSEHSKHSLVSHMGVPAEQTPLLSQPPPP